MRNRLFPLVGFVLGLAMSANAAAVAVIADADPANLDPAVLARETLSSGTNIVLFNNGANGAFDIQFNLGFPLAAGAANYAGRLDCQGVTFAGSATFSPVAANTSGTQLSGGAPVVLPGGKSIVFSISNNGGTAATPADGLTLNIGNSAATSFVKLDNVAVDAICAFSFYDSASKAMAGSAERLYSPGAYPYIKVASGIALTSDTGTLVAGLSPITTGDRSYTDWSGGFTQPAGIATLPHLAYTGTVQFNAVANAFGPDGIAVTAASLYPAGSRLVLQGSYPSAAVITLDLANTCAAPAYTLNMVTSAFTLNTLPTMGVDYTICYKVPGGTTAAARIPASTWTLQLQPANGQAGASTAGGIIRREGAQLQATLTHTQMGWVSRIVAFNSSGADMAYTVDIYPEEGNTATVNNPGFLTGTLKAGKMTVIELTFAGIEWKHANPPRATMVLSAEGKQSDLKAMYQIVHPEKGTISNAQMVRMDAANVAF